MSRREVRLSADGGDGGPEETGTAATGAHGDGAGDPFDPEDDGPYMVHGVAVPEDGLTFGKDEIWTYWPEQVGRSAEGQMTGRNIVDLHPEEPTNDDVIGEITGEKYIDGVGLSWSGEVDSRKRAKQIHRGRLDSSPYLYAHDGGESTLPEDAPEGTRVASEISKIRDIGLVPDGAIEGSEVSMGSHPGIEDAGEVQTALSEGFGGTYKPEHDESESMSNDGDGQSDLEDLQERLEALEEENESLKDQNRKLRRPYLEVVTEGTELEPDAVDMDADALAQYFEGGEGEESPEAGAEEGGEAATALSAAPLTAQPGTPPGEGRPTGLSGGDPGGSSGEDGATETDADLETLKARRNALSDRGTGDYAEQLDDQIAAKEGGD